MNRLKELRQEKKLSQKELAENIGVHYRTLQNWENGESQIKPEKAQMLADFFGVHIGYLLGYSLSRDNMLVALAPYTIEEDSDDTFEYDTYTALSEVLGTDKLEKIKNTISVELKNSFGHYFEESNLGKSVLPTSNLVICGNCIQKNLLNLFTVRILQTFLKSSFFIFLYYPKKKGKA